MNNTSKYFVAAMVVLAGCLLAVSPAAAGIGVNFYTAGTGSGTFTGVWTDTTGTAHPPETFVNLNSVAFWKDTHYTFTANPSEGSTFLGWAGGYCSGTGPCVIYGQDSGTVALIATYVAQTPASVQATVTVVNENIILHIPSLTVDGVTSYWADLQYMPSTNSEILFKVTGIGSN